MFHDRLAVESITVPVSVQARGNWLQGLDSAEFRLEIDGHEVLIEDFDDRFDAPISIVFLLDLSGSMASSNRLATGQAMLRCLVESLRPDDTAALAVFAGRRVELLVPFTAEPDKILEAAASRTAWGTTAVRDALATAPGIAEESTYNRRAVVLLTDGHDNASKFSLDELRPILSSSGLPLFVVEVGAPPEPSLNPSAVEIDASGVSLAQLANATGGHSLGADSRTVREACRQIDGALRHRYVLGFTTRAGDEASFHDIRVAIAGKKRQVRHRTTYFGAAPANLRQREPQSIQREKR